MSSHPSPARATSSIWVIWLVIATVVAGFCMRLVGLSYPPYDAHSFRQTQTLSTIENFYEQGIDLLRPKTIYTGYPGTFVLEFPLFQAASAVLYTTVGSHIEIVRLLNIMLGAASAWLVFRIGSRFLDYQTGVVAALLYWLAPLNIVYQRSMLIDPTAVFFALVSFDQLSILLNKSTPARQRDSRKPSAVCLALLFVSSVITALIKALYLWPAVLLLAQQLLERRCRLDLRMWQAISIFALAGGCFVLWHIHATRINNETVFTRGTNAMSLLGFSNLLTFEFYREFILSRPKRWLGAIGAMLYAAGLVAAWLQRGNANHWRSALLLFLIPPSYIVCFADINRPHDYYQLIITPFLALISAFGATQLFTFACQQDPRVVQAKALYLSVCAVGLIMSSIFTYHVWMRAPTLDGPLLRFESLVDQKFQPNSPAMVFVSTKISGAGADWFIPQYIYAANLWGYGRAVTDAEHALRYFDEMSEEFPKLDYLVFYGMERPRWVPANYREELVDEKHQLFVFRCKHADR